MKKKDKKKLPTPKQKYKRFLKLNPVLEKLRQQFNLEL